MTRKGIERHLELIHLALRALRKRQEIPKEAFLADSVMQEAVAYRILQLVESCFKMGLAIIEMRDLRGNDTYKGTFRTLYHKGIISEAIETRLEALVSFRNHLVHEYWDVDPEDLYRTLHEDIGVAEQFAQIAYAILMEP